MRIKLVVELEGSDELKEFEFTAPSLKKLLDNLSWNKFRLVNAFKSSGGSWISFKQLPKVDKINN